MGDMNNVGLRKNGKMIPGIIKLPRCGDFLPPKVTLWALITPVLTPVSNCAEFKMVFISTFNGNIRQKMS